MKRTHDLLLSGYYGFGNAGDEAILEASVLAFQERGIKVAALSRVPEETSRKLGIPTYSRKGLGTLLQAILRSKVVLSGGGGLFQDTTSFRSLVYYLRILLFAKNLGRKTMVFAQGIGPVHSALGQKLIRWVCNHLVDALTVRDSHSLQLLLAFGVKRKIEVTADLAFLLPEPSPNQKELLQTRFGMKHSRKKLLGVVLRKWPSIESHLPFLARAISKLSRDQDLLPVLIAFQPGMDLPIVDALHKDLDVPHIRITDSLSPRELLALVAGLDMMVAMRFHALLFAARTFVPFLGIAYDEKVTTLAQSLGAPSLELSGLSTDELFQTLDLVWEKREDIRELFKIKIPSLSRRAETNIDLAEELVRM